MELQAKDLRIGNLLSKHWFNDSGSYDDAVKVEGHKFADPATLLTWLDKNYKKGDVVNMQVYRGDKIINIAVALLIAGM